MVWCDVARMVIMVVIAAAEHQPATRAVLLALLLLSSLFTPPFDAARSATLPAVLGPRSVRDRGRRQHRHHATDPDHRLLPRRVIGDGRSTPGLLINAATFGVSAILVRTGVRARDPGLSQERRTRSATRDRRRLPAGLHQPGATRAGAAGLLRLAVRRGARGPRRGLGGPRRRGPGPGLGPGRDHGSRTAGPGTRVARGDQAGARVVAPPAAAAARAWRRRSRLCRPSSTPRFWWSPGLRWCPVSPSVPW